MSLAPGEQETLTEIEHSLCRSDPRLAAMFAVFSRQIFARQGPVRELLSPWRPRSRRFMKLFLLVVVIMCLCAIVAGIVMTSHSGGVPPGASAPVSGAAKFGPHP
jgi:hypothetical protein